MSDERSTKGQFKPGQGGRRVGSRNRLQTDFLKALAADFKENGEETLRIARKEKPTEYLKIIASILPKELMLAENVLGDMSDEDLAIALETIRRAKQISGPAFDTLAEIGIKRTVN